MQDPRTLKAGIATITICLALAVGSAAAGAEPAFDSGNLTTGQSYSWHSTEAGEFKYHCGIHSSMTAKIVVTDGDGMGETTEIRILNSAFDPASVSILKGADVKWTNLDAATHRVVADPRDAMMDKNDSMMNKNETMMEKNDTSMEKNESMMKGDDAMEKEGDAMDKKAATPGPEFILLATSVGVMALLSRRRN